MHLKHICTNLIALWRGSMYYIYIICYNFHFKVHINRNVDVRLICLINMAIFTYKTIMNMKCSRAKKWWTFVSRQIAVINLDSDSVDC